MLRYRLLKGWGNIFCKSILQIVLNRIFHGKGNSKCKDPESTCLSKSKKAEGTEVSTQNRVNLHRYLKSSKGYKP